jgi:hypothetical protein
MKVAEYKGKIYTCTVCGKKEPWGEGWGRWSSIAHDETCPFDVPFYCSPECSLVVTQKIRAKEWKLPYLMAEPGGFAVVVKRSGY